MLFNSYSSLVPVQIVSGVDLINKDCTKDECILLSVGVSAETLTCRAAKVLELVSSLHVTNLHPALQPVTPPCQIDPVHELTPMYN